MVTGGTVADLLKKHGIAVSESDILSHGEKLPLYSNLSMTIKRVIYETVTETAPIDFQTVKTPVSYTHLSLTASRRFFNSGLFLIVAGDTPTSQKQ